LNNLWYVEIGTGFAKYDLFSSEYIYELEDLFFLKSGKQIDEKEYKKPEILEHHNRSFPISKPCNPPGPGR